MLYLLDLFGCILASTLVNGQTTTDYVITNIDIPPGGTIVAGSDYFSSTVHATVSSSFNYSAHTGSWELMAGAKDAADSAVVDLMLWNGDTKAFFIDYYFPANLPLGPYHFRVNVTNDNGNSALSDTFLVIAPVFDCLTPPPWKNITSVSDPNYRSFFFQSPPAGTVIPLGSDLNGWATVYWDYKDYRNYIDQNIINIQFDFVNANTSQATGSYILPQQDWAFTDIPFAGSHLTPGPWRIRANYSNPFEAGPNGSTLSYLSEVMYFSGDKSLCDGIGRSNISAGNHNGDTGRIQSDSWKLPMGLALGLVGFIFLVWSVSCHYKVTNPWHKSPHVSNIKFGISPKLRDLFRKDSERDSAVVKIT